MGTQWSCLQRPSADVQALDRIGRCKDGAPLKRASLMDRLSICCGGHDDDMDTLTACNTSIGSSVYGLDAPYESDQERAMKSPAPMMTSASRLLSEYYSLVLESDHHTFFIDANGRLAEGAYLNEIAIIDSYFAPNAAARRRASVPSKPRTKRKAVQPIYPSAAFDIYTDAGVEMDAYELMPPLRRPRIASLPAPWSETLYDGLVSNGLVSPLVPTKCRPGDAGQE